MDAVVLAASLGCLLVVLWTSRSLARAVLGVAVSVSAIGLVISFAHDLGWQLDRSALQILLVVALALPALFFVITRPSALAPRRRQLLGIALPVLAALIFFVITMAFWTEPDSAFLHPVSFLIGHGTAEDNAKWLDFAGKFASGQPINQLVPMGGPLQLVVVFWGTVAGVISQAVLGGYNEVAVAANSVIFSQFGLVAIAPLALAPIAEMNMGRPATRRIPVPALWLGSIALMAAVLVVTGYGHLTFQYVMFVAALWSAVFLSRGSGRWMVLSSLCVAATMTVWLPLNVLAVVILLSLAAVMVARVVKTGWRSIDPLSLGMWVVVAVATYEPIRSSILYLFNSGVSSAAESAGPVRGVVASFSPRTLEVRGLLSDIGLFASPGGTEPIGTLLAVLTAGAVLAAAAVVLIRLDHTGLRLLPIGTLAVYASAITLADAWVTGSAPHYGSLKFGFLVIVVALSTTLPLAVCAANPQARSMTPLRWTVVGGAVVLLMLDTLLPRSIAAARPEQWNPTLPYSNALSWWWPADVNGTALQPISNSVLGCVYLPNGANAPSAILTSQLSGGDRVYACSRILSGLAGADGEAQPFVDWLRSEWLTNTPAWQGKRGYLAEMPPDVRRRPIILLDDLSNVIGVESLDSLLARFPATDQ